MKIKEAKEEAKEEFRKNNCPAKVQRLLMVWAATAVPLQDSICQITVKLLIRTYIIDYMLRSIFHCQHLHQRNVIDNLLIRYIASMIEEDLKKYGEDIFINISDVADNIYAKHLDDERTEEEVGDSDSGEVPAGKG